MQDCTYILYELLRDLPSRDTSFFFDPEEDAQLRAAQARLEGLPPEHRQDLLDLIDSMDGQRRAQSHHAFALGLDLGLSISRELRSFQSEP